MRNLVQYPITAEEVIDTLKWIPGPNDDCGIGSLNPLIRHKLEQFLSRPEIMKQLLDSMRFDKLPEEA